MAEWEIISTFSDPRILDRITVAVRVSGTSAYTDVSNGRWVVYAGKELSSRYNNIFAMLDLGVDIRAASIASGKPVTLYLEIIQPTVNDGLGGTRKSIIDMSWGLINCHPSQILVDRWNSFNALERIGIEEDAYEIRNGAEYETISQLHPDTPYKIWMVIDYNYNVFESYILGGQWPVQTRMDSKYTYGYWFFRQVPAQEDEIRHFTFAVSRGSTIEEKSLDPGYMDNLALDVSGENLTIPQFNNDFGNWGPYPILDSAGHVDTAEWLGWLCVDSAPSIWCYSLDGWIYLEEPDDPDAWVYVFK